MKINMFAFLIANKKINLSGFIFFFTLEVYSSEKNSGHLKNNLEQEIPETNFLVEEYHLKNLPIQNSRSKNPSKESNCFKSQEICPIKNVLDKDSSLSQQKLLTDQNKELLKINSPVNSFKNANSTDHNVENIKKREHLNNKIYPEFFSNSNSSEISEISHFRNMQINKENILQEYTLHFKTKTGDISQNELINYIANEGIDLKSYLKLSAECKNTYYRFILLGFHETLIPIISKCFTDFTGWKNSLKDNLSDFNIKKIASDASYLELLASDNINMILNSNAAINKKNKYEIMKKIFEKEKNDIKKIIFEGNRAFNNENFTELIPEKEFKNLILAFIQALYTYEKIISDFIIDDIIKIKSQIYIFLLVLESFLENLIKNSEYKNNILNETSLKYLNSIIESNSIFLKKYNYQSCDLEEAADILLNSFLVVIFSCIHINSKTLSLTYNKDSKEKEHDYIYKLMEKLRVNNFLRSNSEKSFDIFNKYINMMFYIADIWIEDYLTINRNDIKFNKKKDFVDENKMELGLFLMRTIRKLF